MVSGVGGGALVLLGLAAFYGVPVVEGLAIALALNVTNALAGLVHHARQGRVLWHELKVLMPTAVVGIGAGAALAHELRRCAHRVRVGRQLGALEEEGAHVRVLVLRLLRQVDATRIRARVRATTGRSRLIDPLGTATREVLDASLGGRAFPEGLGRGVGSVRGSPRRVRDAYGAGARR